MQFPPWRLSMPAMRLPSLLLANVDVVDLIPSLLPLIEAKYLSQARDVRLFLLLLLLSIQVIAVIPVIAKAL